MKSLTKLILGTCILTGCNQPNIFPAFNKASNIVYEKEANGQDFWQKPWFTKAIGKGDCEDKALYLQDLLKRDNIESEVIFGAIVDGTNLMGHAWVEMNLDGKKYVLDPTSRTIKRLDIATEYIRLPCVFENKIREYEQR